MRRARPTPFVVLASPRTGSSWLVDLLDSHPRIVAYGELFGPGDSSLPPYGSRDLPRFAATTAARRRGTLAAAQHRYLGRVFAPRPGVAAAGFKLMHRQLRGNTSLLASLAMRRARAVRLGRDNVLEQMLSWETAVARNRFHATAGDDVGTVRVRLDLAELTARLERRERAAARARRSLDHHVLPCLRASYERLREAPRDELARIADFLGVEPREWPASSRLVRVGTTSWRTSVENAEEVETALAGTAHSWMLGDAR